MNHNLSEIYRRFEADGSFLSGALFGNGHIHDTFRIITAESDKDDYILQKINSNIFKNVPDLQHNIETVTNHIRSKLKNIPGSDVKRKCLQLIPSREGKSWIMDEAGNYWRMYTFIPEHTTYETVNSPSMATEGGRAVGKFQAMLSDIPGEKLYSTIPNFHNVSTRLEAFLNVVKADPANRVKSVRGEIGFVLERAEEMKTILNLGEAGRIPVRITHNDTKFNNILFDKDDRALCIIDLDTVMPGFVHYDFGDAIRTAANTAREDETDLSKINMNVDIFRAYAEGYLSETSNTLNENEKEYLSSAPGLITFIMGLRFLTDFIAGDNYYKIHHPEHNIERARSQFTLLKSMEEQFPEMKRIITKLTR